MKINDVIVVKMKVPQRLKLILRTDLGEFSSQVLDYKAWKEFYYKIDVPVLTLDKNNNLIPFDIQPILA